MSLAPNAIDPYLTSVFFAYVANNGLPLSAAFMRRVDVENGIAEALQQSSLMFSKTAFEGHEYLASELFDAFFAETAIIEDGDELSGAYYQIVPSRVKRLCDIRLSADPIYARRARIGEKYIEAAFESYDAEHQASDDIVQIPASDRLVLLSDNEPKVQELRETAQGLAEALRSANDVGDFNDEELIVASYEVDQLAAVLRQENVRSSYISEVAPRVLRWVAEKAAGAAVGKAALALLVLIGSFFGLSF